MKKLDVRTVLVVPLNLAILTIAAPGFAQGVFQLWGDPHVTTFDGVSYDIHEAGAFLDCGSAAGPGLTIQSAHKAWSTEVSAVAARSLAIKRGSHSVVFDLAATLDGNGEFAVTIYPDGAPGQPWPAGATYNAPDLSIVAIRPPEDPSRTIVTIDDGAEVGIRFFGNGQGTLMNIRIELPPSYMGTTSGLCGTWNDRKSDDLLMSEGVLPRGPRPLAAAGFARSWRIEGCSAQSLFPPDIPDPYDPNVEPFDPSALDPACVKSALVACKAAGLAKSFAEPCSRDACTIGDQTLAIAVAVSAQADALP